MTIELSVATALIDHQALQHNALQIRQLTSHSQIMAMIKADGYGHGLLQVAQALSSVDSFGVARLEEALQLREVGIIKPIVVFNSVPSMQAITLSCQYQLTLVLHSLEQLAYLEQAIVNKPIRVWLKIDTGLHRLGITAQQAAAVYQRLSHCRNVQQPIGLLSHFSRSDELTAEPTQRQITQFDDFARGKPGLQSLASSCAILQWPQSHRDCVRPGLLLYGISPLSGVLASELGLRPVMTLQSQLLAVREHPAGAPVGYGADWHSQQATRLGVVALGYGDGYPRDAPSGTPLLVNGRRVPLVGRVSMDLLTVDLGPDATERSGAAVTAWGAALPVETVAQHLGVSAYELVTRLTNRVIKQIVIK
ncbi:alanine racemase [unidentified bacterial endosymbiont]|uniref:alanine racemase n=1 Tax=unidentified bacterial endosymbiont TaxID=2355 RepID=UPI00209D8D19|nr:alanine racemase [unidentified bacterial endosymbiont]